MKRGYWRRQIPDHRKAARAFLCGGGSQLSALTGAGYPPKQTRKGFIASLNPCSPLRQFLKDALNRWIKVAEILPSLRDRANLVRIRLL